MRLIDAEMLCKYCDNNINHSITPNEIMRMPYIEAEPVKHARWYHDCEDYARCSVCNEHEPNGAAIFYTYCPNCGAKMDLKDGETK